MVTKLGGGLFTALFLDVAWAAATIIIPACALRCRHAERMNSSLRRWCWRACGAPNHERRCRREGRSSEPTSARRTGVHSICGMRRVVSWDWIDRRRHAHGGRRAGSIE